MSQPKSRIAANVSTSNVTLPDVQSTSLNASMSGFAMPSGGGVGGGEGGLNGSGRGGLLGNGRGTGVGPGTGVGFVAMFGKKLDARRLGVVLDVSGSMHPHLPMVVKEANKISGGCPIVMFPGCGAQNPKDRNVSRLREEDTNGRNFDNFWRTNFTPKGMKPSDDSEMPSKETYSVFNKRKDTYFFEKSGTGNAWVALVSDKLRGADALYWFCDFQDAVDKEQLEEIRDTLIKRKQKLYVHASGNNPRSLKMVEEYLVKPTGGEVLKIELKPAPAAK
jgi:hypothetical protein